MKHRSVQTTNSVSGLAGIVAQPVGRLTCDQVVVSSPAPQIRSTILALYKLVCMYVCMTSGRAQLHNKSGQVVQTLVPITKQYNLTGSDALRLGS